MMRLTHTSRTQILTNCDQGPQPEKYWTRQSHANMSQKVDENWNTRENKRHIVNRILLSIICFDVTLNL